MKNAITGKYFLWLFLPALAILLAITFGSIRLDAKRKLASLQITEAANIEIAASTITQDFESVSSDLIMLSKNPDLLRYLDSGAASARLEVAQHMAVLSKEKGLYDQVRYLDADGMETIRINHNNGTPSVVPPSELQNKAGRYFFADTIKLQRGEIFVSPLDLNIEHDKIEDPYKPMIRFGTPVFDRSGQKKGVVLLNYYGIKLLNHFKTITGQSNHRAMLLNRDGYWLSSPTPKDEWGFMLNNQRSFANAYPDEWKVVSTTRQGNILTPNGLFTFTTILPLLPQQHSTTGTSSATGSSTRKLQDNEYYWKIVSHTPPELLPNDNLSQYPIIRMIFWGTLLLIALGSLYLANAWTARRRAQESLEESEAHLREITSTMGEGLYVMDGQGHISFTNPEARHLLGWSETELAHQDAHELFHYKRTNDEPYSSDECEIRKVVDSGQVYRSEDEVFWCKDGSALNVAVCSSPIMRQGEIVSSVTTFSNITERKRAERALQTAKDYAENLIDTANAMFLELDIEGKVKRFNPAAEQITGYTLAEVKGRNWFEIIAPRNRYPEVWEMFEKLSAGGLVRRFENSILTKSGEERHIIWQNSEVRENGQVTGVVTFGIDITERKLAEQQIKQLAYYDTLTNLPNRRLLLDRLNHAFAQAKRHRHPMAIMFLDLDHFKRINDTLGHDIGDELLKVVAVRLEACIRDEDTVSRQGGDEFIIVLPEITHPQDAATVAEKIITALAQPVIINGMALPLVTTSIGISVHPINSSDDVTELMKKADMAMYSAKKAGRNSYRFFKDMT